jgi:hypothetical protein
MNKTLKLIETETKRELKVGDTVTTFRGETGILTGWKEPYDFDSTKYAGARVYVKTTGHDWTNEWNPGVIGAEFFR